MKYLKLGKVLFFILLSCFLVTTVTIAMDFNEAPEFKKLVEKGELPPVEERLPVSDDVYVVDVNENIGQYGGIIRTATNSPQSAGDDTLLTTYLGLVLPSPDGSELKPQVAKKIESSPDKTTWTIYLRKGMKWSDGHSFTVDDILFWYNDVLLNKELTPAVGDIWKYNGEVMEVNKIDNYTVEFKFTGPKPYLKYHFVHQPAWSILYPKHYLKQFHPNYTSKKELEKNVKEEGFDEWYEYFSAKNENKWGRPLTLERPTLSSYVLVKRTSSVRIFERNPFFWKVDEKGNQLPYIDRIESTILSEKEVIQGQIMSGDIDFAGYYTDTKNYPMYKKYEEEGGYNTILWDSEYGSESIYMVNLTHQDPALREIFQDVRFRRALSLAMNREEINKTFYFGKATPRQYTVLDTSRYFEPEFANSYIEYDLEKANKLLDEMGLEKDNNGLRIGPDGEKINFTITIHPIASTTVTKTELVAEYWKKLGLEVNVQQVSGELQAQRAPGNMLDATVWTGDKASDVLFPVTPQFFVPVSPGWERTIWPAWGRWFATNGNKGEEPPQNIKDLYGWWKEMLREPDEAKQIKLGKKILRAQAENLWVIGSVGKAPKPMIFDKDLGNVPKNTTWGWDTVYLMNQDPEQLYFKDGINQE